MNTILGELQQKLPIFKQMESVTHFQLMTLMGWLGNEAVVAPGAKGEETTCGGICHCMAGDRVHSVAKERMVVAEVCDKRKQLALFQKTCNHLKMFLSYGEHCFCESSREQPSVDTFMP